VTNTATEDANIQSIVPLALRGWEYLGYLPSLTDVQVAEAARQLMLFDRAKNYAQSAHGLLRGQEQGVRRIAEWIVRTHIGTIAPVSPLQSFSQWPNVGPTPAPGKI